MTSMSLVFDSVSLVLIVRVILRCGNLTECLPYMLLREKIRAALSLPIGLAAAIRLCLIPEVCMLQIKGISVYTGWKSRKKDVRSGVFFWFKTAFVSVFC